MRTMLGAALAALAVLAGAVGAQAAITSSEAARLTKAAQVVRGIDQIIPPDLWADARCVAVIPDVKKAAFMVGGEYGKGVMSCRAGETWSAPVFLQLAKGSWGFQVGAEQVDVVLLVMNESGVQKLLRDTVSLGADASVAAGPIGRQGHVGTDAQLTAEILSYSRAEGLFAGIDLSGGILRPDENADRDVYGGDTSPRMILATRRLSAPTAATELLDALAAQPVVADVSIGRVRSDSSVNRGPEITTTTGAAPPEADELRARIAEMRATLDRLLENAAPGPVGTGGSSVSPMQSPTDTSAPATVTVDRAQLLKLRDQLDALAAALNGRR